MDFQTKTKDSSSIIFQNSGIKIARWAQKAVWPLVFLLFACFTRTRIQGQEFARQIKAGPVLIVANHKSYLDPLLVGLCFPYCSALYPLRFIGKDSLFQNRLRQIFFGLLGGFPAMAGTGLANSLFLPAQILSQKGSVVFFPEGRRVRGPELGEFRIGVAKLASMFPRVPILPIAIAGAGEIGRWGLLFKRPRITIRIGQPFTFEDLGLNADNGGLAEALKAIKARIEELYRPLVSAAAGYHCWLVRKQDFPGLATHNFWQKMVRVVSVPLLNHLPPRLLQSMVRQSSPYGRKVIARPGTSHSLEEMYTKTNGLGSKSLYAAADYFFHNFVSQPRAVKNRLKIVESLLEVEFKRLEMDRRPTRMLNLGGGSSRAVIQTLARLSAEAPLQLSVTTIDKDPSALELGRKIAAEHGVSRYFNWVEGNVKNLPSLTPPSGADLVEMVGLLDYFNNEAALRLLSDIRNAMVAGGVFITANVTPNPEMRFVRNVGWPEMHYKTAADLRALFNIAGFDLSTWRCLKEPMGVHLICVIKK